MGDTVTLLDTDTPESMATPDTAVPTVLDTDTVTVLATTDTEATTARGPLMPSPLPPLRPPPIPTTDTATLLDTDTPDTMVLATPDTAVATVLDTDTVTVLATTDTEATTARGPLMPSPPLMLLLMPRLIPTTDTTAVDTAATVTATATDTTVKCPDDSSQPKTILGTTSSEKWIAQFGSTPTSATSFSATMLAQARNGEQEAKENQNVMI